MSMPTNEAYSLLQTNNILEEGGAKLPKNIMNIIGLYADEPTSTEIYEALKDFLKKTIFLDSYPHAGLTYYGLSSSDLINDSAIYRDPRANQAWQELKSGQTSSFVANLNRVLDYLLTAYSEYQDGRVSTNLPILHPVLEDNNLVLLKAFLKRRRVIASNPPSTLTDLQISQSHNSIYAVGLHDLFEFPLGVLHLAAMKGSIDAYRLLMNAGAVNNIDVDPLILAVAYGQFKFVEHRLLKQDEYPLFNTAIVVYPKAAREHPAEDGLLRTAFEAAYPNEQLITLLIQRGARRYSLSNLDIERVVRHRFKDAASAAITAIGMDRVLLIDECYRLIDLVGGYKKVCELTNTAETDPRALILIAKGVFSQALQSRLTTNTSLGILRELMEEISPFIPHSPEATTAPIVKVFTRLHNRPWYETSIAQPDPIETDLSPAQRENWFK